MTMDDDEVQALENRLRTNGWASKPEPFFQASRIRPAADALMPIEAKVTQVARYLAHHFDGVSWPTYQGTADEFGLSYDNAVLAIGQAKRLAGGA